MNARRLLLGSVVLCAAAGLLTGCAAGQHAETAQETQVADANSAQAGDIALRGVSISAPDTYYAKGGSAPLELIIVNTSTTGPNAGDDTLTGVSSPIATSSTVTASTPSDTGLPSTSALPSSTPVTSGAPTPTISIARGDAVSLGFPGNPRTVVLEGLTDNIYSGQSFPVTFTFAKAGTITLNVAVKLNTSAQVSPSYITDLAPTSD